MIRALALVASPHILLVAISSLSCTIALLLHELVHLAYKESHSFIINVTTSSSSLDSFLDLSLFLDEQLALNATLFFFFFLSSSSFFSSLSTPPFPHGMSLMS
jgi:hypothetical protein